ncbi:hypothetical protein [Candidatus Bathycorpusculum sp.]|jgi:hypothetical protein|uniref:hypothetical protein n=1 Tax=Candidatus Bathycorpusculum sp. TaxID=2994959 RepID=UPI00281EF59F|nr:hypothetical protein [Candidatus Termitimicrobium sp.]MDR2719614.1 hypothetical protein [Nitrososphaerota archaeon]
MSKRKQYDKLEKTLEQKYKSHRENEVVLSNEDFKNGKLTVFGYNHLKQQCDYIPYSEDIEIKIPKECESGFKDTLESMGANELSRIKKDRRDTKIAALVLLFTGILFVVLGNILEFFRGNFFQNIVVIVSWVFVWAAVEKWFFDRRALKEKRKSLLQILSAKITVQ